MEKWDGQRPKRVVFKAMGRLRRAANGETVIR